MEDMPCLYEHDAGEKATAIQRGPSFLRKTEELGDRAHVFTMVTFWDPTHQCQRVATRLPEGETFTNLNKLASMLRQTLSRLRLID